MTSGDPQPHLLTRDLRVRNSRHTALHPLSLDRGTGGILWVTGQNGAGKTSLLMALAGVTLSPSGAVVRRGQRPDSVTWLHPGMALPATLRVGDWLGLMNARRHPGAVPPGLLPEVPLNRRVGRLSTGEERRLILAVTLAWAREFLFLDEPFEHLSPDAKTSLTRGLRAMQEGRVIVVATNQTLPEVRPGDSRLVLGEGP